MISIRAVHIFVKISQTTIKPYTDVASNLLAIDLRLDVHIACDGLQQKFQHAEYFTCDPLRSQPLVIRFSNIFFTILDFHKLSNDI